MIMKMMMMMMMMTVVVPQLRHCTPALELCFFRAALNASAD